MSVEGVSPFSALKLGSISEKDANDYLNNLFIVGLDSNGTFRQNLLTEIEEACPITIEHWPAFKLCCDILSAVSEACRYEAVNLRRILRIAAKITFTMRRTTSVSSLASLQPLHIWNNVPLWIDIADTKISEDIRFLDGIYKTMSSEATSKLFNWKRAEVKIVFVCNRIWSMLKSMKSFGLKADSIETFLAAIRNRYRLSEYGIEISDFALNKMAGSIVNNAIAFLSSRPNQQVGNGTSTLLRQFNFHEEHVDVGYNPLLSCALIPIVGTLQGNILAQDVSPDLAQTRCICGQSVGNWKIMGMPSNQEMLLHSKLVLLNVKIPEPTLHYNVLQRLPSYVCESCYRGCFSTSSEDSEAYLHLPSHDVQCVALSPVLASPQLDTFAMPFNRNVTEDFEKFLHRTLRLPWEPVTVEPDTIRSNNTPLSQASSPHSEGPTISYNAQTSLSQMSKVPTFVNDDVSVMSGFSRLDVDDESVARGESQPRGELSPMSDVEFHDFIRELWDGIPITLVYSNNPPIEKRRLLYLRSSGRSFNEMIITTVAPIRQGSVASSTTFVDIVKRQEIPLFLGWARQSEAGKIMWNPKKSVALDTVRNIKVGSKKWRSCVKLATDTKIIVVKLDENESFQRTLRGLTQLIASITS